MALRSWILTFRRWLDEKCSKPVEAIERYSNDLCIRVPEKINPFEQGKNTKFSLSNPCMLTFAELMLGIPIKESGKLRFL
jgi:hypothetical protein